MDVAVRAMSLPVVVIVHVTQQPPAQATIFWDNAFSEGVSSHEYLVVLNFLPAFAIHGNKPFSEHYY